MKNHLIARSGPAPRASGSAQAAFTLIELMITVAVIGILTALAYPAYINYLIRGSLVDAPNGLNSMRAQMEQYFQDNRSYQQVGNGPAPPCLTAQTFGKFTVQCTAASLVPTTVNGVTLLGYKLTATGAAGSRVAGFTFTLDNANNQATFAAPTGWPTSTQCWLTSKTASCP
jgi:type IV pilus assembly protein PilE